MKNKYELMGTYVEVQAYMKPVKPGSKRSYIKYKKGCPRVGMVVGYRTVYEGDIKSGSTYFDSYPEDYNPPVFIPRKSIKVLLVCFWPTYKPVLVLPEDLTSNIMQVYSVMMNLHPTTYLWTEEQKQWLRDDVKNQPRDEKGRWVVNTSYKVASE